MRIVKNTTGMVAGLAVASDKDARDHCVVAVKGTFTSDIRGHMTLAHRQAPLISTDEHYGDPAITSVRYECDFSLEKPRTDVIVVGSAVTPKNKRVTELSVRLEVQGRNKELAIYGERRWARSLGSLAATSPQPFTEMPLTFQRAFGGQDDSLGPDRVAVELRNPLGVGFHPHRESNRVIGTPLPNIAPMGHKLASPSDTIDPVGFGCVGRSWQPRISFAGTYDEGWRDDCAPYLPSDFDSQYYQCAPRDQQFPHFRGGEVIRCYRMADQEVVHYVIPSLSVPVTFSFTDGNVQKLAVLDTVTLEPQRATAFLVWRSAVPLRKKLTELRAISVGEDVQPVSIRNGKPVFASLGSAVTWLRRHRKGPRK